MKRKQFLSVLLASAMIVSQLPAAALAAVREDVSVPVVAGIMTESSVPKGRTATGSDAQKATGSDASVATNSNAAFAADEGHGTEEEPYQISTAKQLQAVKDDLSAYYELQNDIDLSGHDWAPVGDMNGMFTGVFNGSGKTISNLSVSVKEGIGVGLFGIVMPAGEGTGVVKNLTIDKANVSGMMAVSAAVGYNIGGTVEQVTVKNAVLTGTYSKSSIMAGGDPMGGNCVGGVVGGNNMGSIVQCTADNVTIHLNGANSFEDDGPFIQCDIGECAGLIVGGSFGGNEEDVQDAGSYGRIADCTASGTIYAEDVHAVGLGGIGGCLLMMEEAVNCSADVTIHANKAHAVGGICGYTGSLAPTEPMQFENCSAKVNLDVPGSTHVGGLVGTGIYYRGMETWYALDDTCAVSGTVKARNDSKYQAGAAAGRAVGSLISEEIKADGLTAAGLKTIGKTERMYRSGEQDSYAEGGDDAADLLDQLHGTYRQLFEGATFDGKYDHYWHDYCAAIVGESQADQMVELMKSSIGGKEGEQGPSQFFCGFTSDVDRIAFDGSNISGYKGKDQVFSHTYRYCREGSLTMDGTPVMPGFAAFESQDGNEDEFKYFFMAPDTPDSTYHIEFRYGSDLDALEQYNDGDYAYWLAAGILDNADETMYENVISLFCLENMDYTADRTASSLGQLKDFSGTWDYYINSQAKPDLLYFTIDGAGNGYTYVGGELDATYQAFAYDNDGSAAKKSGIYVAHNEEGEISSAHYSITRTSDGRLLLTFMGEEDGESFSISYVKRTVSDNSSDSDSSDDDSSSGSSQSAGSHHEKQYTNNVDGSWVQNGEGKWSFRLNNGSSLTGWGRIQSAAGGVTTTEYYHFGTGGIMDTGWFADADGSWYYLSSGQDGSLGRMVKGWHYETADSRWYYLDPASGAMRSGWNQIDGSWYYFSPAVGTTWIFNEASGSWEYAGSNIRPYGSMYVNEQTPDGYTVDANGARIQ